MSELSSIYTEYERVSKLFRCLNETILFIRQTQLGIRTAQASDETILTANLEKALAELGTESGGGSSPVLLDRLAQDNADISPSTLMTIKRRVHNGLNTLTEQDLEVIEKVTDLLDSRSETLFRRIQK